MIDHAPGNELEERGGLYWINLRLPKAGSFFELPPEEGLALARKLTSLPKRHFAGSPVMRSILENILQDAVQPPSTLQRFKARFKSEMGTSPRDFILRAKIDAAQESLSKGKESITEIAFRHGFSSSQYFATVFRRYTGQTPLEFRVTGPRKQLRDVGLDILR